MPKKSHKTDSKETKSVKNHDAEQLEKYEKKNTSLRLEKKTLKALKIQAIEEDTSVQKLIERLVVEYLEKIADEEAF